MLLKNNILTKYFIVRNGDFATCANTKIIYSLFAILLSLGDYFINNSTSCFRIMVGSTLIWTIIEFFLYFTNTRIIKPMYLRYKNSDIKIPKYLSLFLQGFQEGGVITTIGLYFGDRLNNKESLYHIIFFHLIILFSVIKIVNKNNYQKASKRQINTSSSLTLMGSVTLYNIYMMYLYPEHIYRQLKMVLTMVYFCSFWTFFAWYKGFRIVEVNDKFASNWDTFLVLAYDIIFEIGIAYLTFYNLFIV